MFTNNMVNFVIANKEFFGIIIPLISISIPLFTFLATKNKEQRQNNFKNFHDNLMKGLANQNGKIGLDQQVAIIYELRNYPEYYPAIYRVLKFQITRWTKMLKQKPHYSLLIDEANETLKYSGKNLVKRKIIQIQNTWF